MFSAVTQIGPNVSISANARIGAGSRLVNCIILDDVEIKVLLITHLTEENHALKLILYPSIFKENAVVIHAIVGWKSSIGRWSRVQVCQEIYSAQLLDIFSAQAA